MTIDWEALLSAFLPPIAIILSLVSTIVSVRSYRFSSQVLKFENAVRLQLADQQVRFYSPSFKEGFSYSVNIGNSGLKPVEVDRVSIDYGSSDDPTKRWRHVIDGRFYLRPGEERLVKFELSKDNIGKTMDHFGIQECKFFLRISYIIPPRQVADAVRHLGGYSRDAVEFVAQRGDALT